MSSDYQADPTARIGQGAVIGRGADIGPCAVVHDGAELGENVVVGAHSVIWEGTILGANTRVFPFCSLGGEPQDKKYRGEKTRLVVGQNNVIREYCFFNRGTAAAGETRVGDGCWLMAYVHIAHDCVVGDGVTIANAAQLGGHAQVGDGAVLGGGALLHQFARVGRGAMVGGGEKIRMDIPPFALSAEGRVGVNAEGMRRAGFAPADIDLMKSAFRVLYRADLPLEEARKKIRALAEDAAADGNEKAADALRELAEFLTTSGRGLTRPAPRR